MSELTAFTPAGGDVRGFYARLGVALPSRSRNEVPVRCFAAPDAHVRRDRDPSCSVNLTSGAWCCHGCGARGGAYDAALAMGHTPRSAIDLLIDCGLAIRRDRPGARSHPPPRRTATHTPAEPTQPRLDVTEQQIHAWHVALARRPTLVATLEAERAWTPAVLDRFHVGFDAGRITVPVRGDRGELVAVARYRPPFLRTPGERKMLMLPGSRRALFPSLAAVCAPCVWLLEGHPDALAAHSVGIAALAIPGDWGWDPVWCAAFEGRDVVVCLDCDDAGRTAAARITEQLAPYTRSLRNLDLDPDRRDGFDVTDALLSKGADWLVERAARCRPS